MLALPSTLLERLRLEAERAGVSLEEYVLDVLSSALDPAEGGRAYAEAASLLLAQAGEELTRGDVRQAAEKAWGAAALAVKAYAAVKEGKRLRSHGELWEYKRRLEEELGDWVYDAWMAANGMHTCFYEGWCNEKDVREALERIRKLVEVAAAPASR